MTLEKASYEKLQIKHNPNLFKFQHKSLFVNNEIQSLLLMKVKNLTFFHI